MGRLKVHRELKSISIERVAQKIWRTSQCLRNWEVGRWTPSAADLIKLANVFEIDPRSLFVKVRVVK